MKFFLLFVVSFISVFGFTQQISDHVKLVSSSKGKSTVDFFEKGKNPTEYRVSIDSNERKIALAFVSVSQNEKVTLTFRLDTLFFKDDTLQFFNNTSKKYAESYIGKGKVQIDIIGTVGDQIIDVIHNGKTVYRVEVQSMVRKEERVWIVPLMSHKLSKDTIQKELNKFYKSAGIRFSVVIQKPFLLKNFPAERLFRNPSEANERYTQEMRYIRNAYLKIHPELKNVHLVFLIPGFQNEEIRAYSVKEKTMTFVTDNSNRTIALDLAHIFASGLQITKDKTVLEENNGVFNHNTWRARNLEQIVYSFFDDYEDIPASTGLVAFYFWKEDALGNIVLPEKGTKTPLFFISRPYKRNTFSYHLRLDDFWVMTIFKIRFIPFNLLHLLAIIGFTGLIIYFGIKVRRWIKAKWKFPRLFRIISLPVIFFTVLLVNYGGFLLVNLVYSLYEVRAGTIDEFNNKSIRAVELAIQANIHPNKIEEKEISSELLVQVNRNIELRQRQPVLYFEATVDRNNYIEKLRCTDARKELELPSLEKSIIAKNHYFVITYKNEKGERLKDEVYNYLGVNITSSITAKDPIRKILVFVNGYRPTSLGSGFQEHFYDIQRNGIEFPDSYNRLYSFDRYLYWQPWNNIDQRFINVFLPTETYYADGHFSVSTSNYRSIIKFSSASTQYPKRCAKGKPHHCYYTNSVNSKLFGSGKKKTLNTINYRSNKSGFVQRKKNGKVAGRNLYHALNELPNSSDNDTLFIVAHSMGFAYSLGMIEELRGKINFGTYLIIAPENPGAGTVNPKEWKEIWQYGSNLNSKYPDPPCLQDGVAPQRIVKGLPAEKRIFIPKKLYTHKGFFDSHFIGYYTWIFDLKIDEYGHIKKH